MTTTYPSLPSSTPKTTSGFASNISNNTTNWFVYDGETPLLELDASGNVYSVTTFGVAGYCGRHISTYAYSWFALFDPSGNTATFARGNGGAGGAYYAYDGFGNRTSTDTYVASDPYLGYGGQSGYYTDWETGLTLCGHRYYDSGNGRFLTRDPIGMAGGVNVYEYCSNNGVSQHDPMGYSTWGGAENFAMLLGCGSALLSLLQSFGQSSDIPSLRQIACSLGGGCVGTFASIFIVAALTTSVTR